MLPQNYNPGGPFRQFSINVAMCPIFLVENQQSQRPVLSLGIT